MNKSMLIGAGLLCVVVAPVIAEEVNTSSAAINLPANPTPASTTSPGASNTDVSNPSTSNASTSNPPAAAPASTPASAPANGTANAPAAATSNHPESSAPTTAPAAATPPTNAPTQPPVETTPTAATTTPTETTSTVTTTPTPAPAPAPAPAETAITPTSALNCNYHIPANNAKLDTNLVLQWAQKATQQTFTLDPSTVDVELTDLKACYTDQGWQSFSDALKKSGNLDAIKQQKLNVSSLIDGQATITQNKDNQWKVIIPIQVVYQNSKEKIVQSLTINLIVSRKVSGDLGIIQIVAIPRQAMNNQPPAAAGTPSAVPAQPGKTTP